jgi:Protein of unknown function (DUF1579)
MSDAPRFTPPVPGSEHKVFEKDVGTWDADVEVRMFGGPPETSRGVAHNRLICGGLWLVIEFRNETTGFEGHGLYSYDVQKKKYVGTWIDSMRTFLEPSEGTWDPDRRIMTFWTDHVGPEGPMRWRETTETVDADTQIHRVFMPSPAGEAEMMTVTYRRRR